MGLPALAPDPGADHGEVFTRRWVVELILDLVGYTSDHDLTGRLIVEPSCGTGAFLLPIVDRLITSAIHHGRDLGSVGGAVRAFDLLDANAERAWKAVAVRLHEAGLKEHRADEIARLWVQTGDFLLHDHEPRSAHFVVGNPPYVRLENVPRPIMDAYRRLCPTMRGRSDIYVGFIERSLALLAPEGVLGFICADRWMRNQYGSRLRELVSTSYAVEAVVSMHDVDAFEDDVSAYPAVVVLRNAPQAAALMADTTASFDEGDAIEVSSWVKSSRSSLRTASIEATRLEGWLPGRGPWPSGTPAQLALVAELEARLPPLEDPSTGTRVGIGVATGSDEVYLTQDDSIVESDRLLPLLRARDLADGQPGWSGSYLVNPWDADGLVDLHRYPKLRGYLEQNGERLRARHIGRTRPTQWYRTIDRVDPDLRARPKLVLPELRASSHPVLDEGRYYPHHNLYFVVSDTWDLEVLGGLLLSGIANLFVGAYCVKMRGGCYRFQAQYLRRIRVPQPGALAQDLRDALADAFVARDVAWATDAAACAYGLRPASVLSALGGSHR